jgi:Tfp pilus assembly protein PilF
MRRAWPPLESTGPQPPWRGKSCSRLHLPSVSLFLRIKRYSPSPAVYLFGAVFLVRMLALSRLTSSPFLVPAQGDMHFYNDWAQRILAGGFTDHRAFYGLPLYPYVLALLYKIFGFSPFIPGFLQALLESGTAVLIYSLGLRTMTDASTPTGSKPARLIQTAALLAGLAWAFFVPAQAYAVILMPTAWLIFVFWFVVWRIVRNDSSPPPGEFLLLGLLIGVTAMGIATILFLIPLLAAASFKPRPGATVPLWRSRAVAIGLLLSGVVAGTSPCWIHNYFVARDPVFLSAHSGINFWIGNNPDANGYPRFPPGLHAGQAAMLQDSITVAEDAAGHPLKRADVSHYWSAKAKSYIAAHPLAWLRLIALKFFNFWSAFRYDDLSIVTSLREHRVILPGLYFGVVAAFAIPGMIFAARRGTARWVIAAILLHMAALLPVFVTERYRLPIVPGLLVCAAFGLTIFWQNARELRIRSLALYLLILGLATLLISWPQRNPSLWALDSYNSGLQALELGRESLDRDKRDAAAESFTVADAKLGVAFAYVPQNAELNFALGELRQVQGRPNEAKSFYASTLQIDPRHERAFNNLGLLALEEERYTLAESFFQHSLAVDSRNAKTHFLLAKAFLAEGNRQSAEQEVNKAIKLSPSQREFLSLRERLIAQSPP